MDRDFDVILDECIDRINRGEDIESCLADYPDHAARLQPALLAMFRATHAYSVLPSPNAKKAARERFDAALEELSRQRETKRSRPGWFHGWTRVWAASAAVLLLVLVTYLSIRPALFPGESAPPTGPGLATPGPQTSPISTLAAAPQPSPDGNFVFLISDDVNAINDFDSVMVTISKIGLQGSGASGQLIEFAPEQGEVDLTQVQGDLTQEIWRGDIPAGEYSNVILEVADVRGILKETGQEIEIKLPGMKLHVSKAFEVSADGLTAFTSDLTVVAAGNDQSGVKYILKPQLDQSGAVHGPAEKPGKPEKDTPGSGQGHQEPPSPAVSAD